MRTSSSRLPGNFLRTISIAATIAMIPATGAETKASRTVEVMESQLSGIDFQLYHVNV